MAGQSGARRRYMSIQLVTAPLFAPASRGQALTLNPASLLSSQHGASGAKPGPSFRARRVAASWCSRSRQEAAGALFLRLLAQARAASAHAVVRSALHAAFVARWSAIIAVAAQSSLASDCSSSPPRQLPPLLASRLCMKSCKTMGGSTPQLPAASPRGLES